MEESGAPSSGTPPFATCLIYLLDMDRRLHCFVAREKRYLSNLCIFWSAVFQGEKEKLRAALSSLRHQVQARGAHS
jgi:hypothetical protein